MLKKVCYVMEKEDIEIFKNATARLESFYNTIIKEGDEGLISLETGEILSKVDIRNAMWLVDSLSRWNTWEVI